MRPVLLLLTMILAACGPGGGGGVTLLPGEAIPALEGLWCGPAGDGGVTIGAVCIKIDAGGNITRIVFEGNMVPAFGTIQTSAEPGVFRFALSNGGAGFFMLSGSGQHLLYLDNTRLLAVLDKTSPSLPASYLRADINDDWDGSSLFLDSAGSILGTAASSLSVLPAFGFDGLQGAVAFQEQIGTTLVVTQPVFGLYSGRYSVPGVENGDVLLFMSPDKQCIGGTLCADVGTFPDACSIVLWERIP